MKLHIIATYSDSGVSQEIFETVYNPNVQYVTQEQFLLDIFPLLKHPHELDVLSVAEICDDTSLKVFPLGHDGKWWFNIDLNKDNENVSDMKTLLDQWINYIEMQN